MPHWVWVVCKLCPPGFTTQARKDEGTFGVVPFRALLFLVSARWISLEQRLIDRVAHPAVAEIAPMQAVATIVDR